METKKESKKMENLKKLRAEGKSWDECEEILGAQAQGISLKTQKERGKIARLKAGEAQRLEEIGESTLYEDIEIS